MVIVLGILSGFIIMGIIALMVDWVVHLDMVRDSTKKYGKGSYKDFVREFDKYEWKTDGIFKRSLFTDDFQSEKIHASIFLFGGIGMQMRTPIDYLKAKLYIRNYIKNNFPEYNHKW